MSRVSLTVNLEWNLLGEVRLDVGDKLVFPKASLRPGLYRFEFNRAQGPTVYIGETDQLARRFQHYRTPGPSQRTNIRLNALMREVLKGRRDDPCGDHDGRRDYNDERTRTAGRFAAEV